MSLAVITAAYYPDQDYEHRFWRLKESCERQRLPLFPYGKGSGAWHTVGSDTIAQFHDAPQVIADLPSQYDVILFTDAADTFTMAGEREILGKLDAIGSSVALAAEPGCYPPDLHHPYLDATRGRPDVQGPWRFPNGGGWIGYRHALIELLGYLRTHHPDTEEAQSRWVQAVASGEIPWVRLDHMCLIFQPMSGGYSSSMAWEGNRMVNPITGSQPAIPHWNGRLGGIEQAWSKAYGD